LHAALTFGGAVGKRANDRNRANARPIHSLPRADHMGLIVHAGERCFQEMRWNGLEEASW
jgi:hypothetical protein